MSHKFPLHLVSKTSHNLCGPKALTTVNDQSQASPSWGKFTPLFMTRVQKILVLGFVFNLIPILQTMWLHCQSKDKNLHYLLLKQEKTYYFYLKGHLLYRGRCQPGKTPACGTCLLPPSPLQVHIAIHHLFPPRSPSLTPRLAAAQSWGSDDEKTDH